MLWNIFITYLIGLFSILVWNIIITVLIGALVGWLAGLIMETNYGFWLNALLGIAGSAMGRLFAKLIGFSVKRISIPGIIISVAGACLVVWLVRKLAGKK